MDGCNNAISESIPNSIITVGTRSILMMRFLVPGFYYFPSTMILGSTSGLERQVNLTFFTPRITPRRKGVEVASSRQTLALSAVNKYNQKELKSVVTNSVQNVMLTDVEFLVHGHHQI